MANVTIAAWLVKAVAPSRVRWLLKLLTALNLVFDFLAVCVSSSDCFLETSSSRWGRAVTVCVLVLIAP